MQDVTGMFDVVLTEISTRRNAFQNEISLIENSALTDTIKLPFAPSVGMKLVIEAESYVVQEITWYTESQYFHIAVEKLAI